MSSIKITALPVLTTPSANAANTVFAIVDKSTGTATTKQLSLENLNVFIDNVGLIAFAKANGAFAKANSANVLAQNAYDFANTITLGSGTGDTVGPNSATDNAVTRFNTTTGKLIQNSLVTIADDGAITAPQASSVIPFYYANVADFPSSATYHGAVAHAHSTGKLYYAHGGWLELANMTDIVAGITTFAALTDNAGLTVDQFYLQAITRLNTTHNSSIAYRFDQYGVVDNPTIYALNGATIAFNLNVSGHPFLIQTSGGSNYNDGLIHVTTTGTVTTGASAQGKVTGTLYWKIPSSISGNYQYKCSVHGGMVGNVTIKDISTI